MAAALDVLGVQLAVLDVTVLDSAKAVVIHLVPQVVIVTVRDVLVLVLVVPDVLAVQAVAPVVRLLARVDAQVARDADQDVLQHVRADVLDALDAVLVVLRPALEVVQVVQVVALVAPQHVLEVARELVMDALVAVADIVILDVLIVHKLVIIMLLLQCQRLLKLQKLIN